MIKKVLSLFIVALMMITSINYVSAETEYLTYGDYQYRIVSNKEVRIKKYNGKESELQIPSEINGFPVTWLEPHSFEHNKYITSVYIPDTVTDIGIYTFNESYNIKSIRFSNNLKRLESFSFSNIGGLEEIILPEGLESTGGWSFFSCWNLKKVVLPNSLKTISEHSFCGCDNLIDVNIPDNVKRIGDEAFSGCWRLESLTLPKSIETFGDDPFIGNNKLILNVYPDTISHKCAEEIWDIPYNLIGNELVESISLDKKSITLVKGKFYNLKTSIYPSNIVLDKGLSWSSTNLKVASVSPNGRVMAKSKGMTTVRVSIIGKSNVNTTCKVTVVNPYKITYKLNGGKNNKSNPSTYYGKVTLKNPTRKGYTFSGWYSDSKFKKKITSFSSGNKTLYAKWTKVKVSKAKTPKLTNVKGKKLKITYSATSGAKGYQIQYSTSKKFTKATTKTVKGKSATYTLAKKTYYVRVRAYKTDSTGSKVYGSWSTVKSIKIKK